MEGNFAPQLFQNPILIFLLIVWSLFWKGIALWKAVKSNQKGWFVALLLINTVGILEILYIFAIDKKLKKVEK
jgi:hypothetical protein